MIPLLRDAVATALTHRTCAHLAIPVDIQAAPSPIPLKKFCASHAALRLQPPELDLKQLQTTAETLVGSPNQHRPRTVIAVGLRGVYEDGMSDAILELAEALNAPVLTRLHAKGVVDESHPLSFGVIGVHGKPGLEAAALVVSSSDYVVSIGVEDATLLVCNMAGIQIRKLIEIQPDAVAVTTRFQADHTLVGHIRDMCLELTSRVEALQMRAEKKRIVQSVVEEEQLFVKSILRDRETKTIEHFAYLLHNNPEIVTTHERELTLPRIESEGLTSILEDAESLWDAIHGGEVRKDCVL